MVIQDEVSKYLLHEVVGTTNIDGTDLGITINSNPISVGAAGAGGMMGPYHLDDMQNLRISKVVALIDKGAHTYTDKEGREHVKNIAREMAAAYGVEKAFYLEGKDAAWNAFLDTHLLTVLSGPNNVHAQQIESIFGRADADKRFVYSEKPLANSLEGAISIAEVDKARPGRIGVVSQNRMWDMLLEARHMIANGVIGEIQNFEIEYQQDWMNPGTPAVWRIEKGVGGELGPDLKGNLGKLIDIMYHAVDTLQFVTGQNISGVHSAYIINAVNEREPAGGKTFGAAGVAKRKVPVGGDSPYHGDDVISTIMQLAGGAIGDMKISQTNAGQKNALRFRVYGSKGSLEFTTDNANDLVHYDGFGNVKKVITRDPNALQYTSTLPDWYLEGLRMNNPPFEMHTPPKHDQGWRNVHKRQALAFALYAQLVTNGQIGLGERSKLYVVPTVAEALNNMKVMKTAYEVAAYRCESITPVN